MTKHNFRFHKSQSSSGMVKIIVMIILIVIILTLAGVDIRQFFNSEPWLTNWETFKEWGAKIIDWLEQIWSQYLIKVIEFGWKNVFQPIIDKIISK